MKIVNAIIHINTRCMSRCITCDFWKKKQDMALSFMKFKDFSHSLKVLGVDTLMISGGEPLLHPKIEQFVDVAYKDGYKILLNTNGIIMDRFIKKIGTKVKSFVVSLDSSTPEGYRIIRGIDAFQKVIKNIKEVKNSLGRDKIHLRCTIQRKNLFELENIFILAKKLNIPLSFNPIDAYSNNFARDKSQIQKNTYLPTLDEIERFRRVIKNSTLFLSFEKSKEGRKQYLSSWYKEDFYKLANYFKEMICSDKNKKASNQACAIPFSTIVIESDGTIKSCFYHKINTLRKQNKLESFKNPKFLEKVIKQIEATQKCVNCRCKLFA